MSNFSPLKGFGNIKEATVNNILQDNLIEYFDYALLDKGNYYNVYKDQISSNGSDFSRLRPADDEYYPSGQVWEGFRGNWVWQSGLAPSGLDAPVVGTDPNNPGISGVYVDNVFNPVTSSGYHVDYFNGRVTFDSPIPVDSVVQAEYSYKYINVVYANNVPWMRQIQMDTQQPNAEFLDVNKGEWNIPPEARLQLPAIAIEIVPKKVFKGYQLGGGQWVYTDVLFHCIAEDEYTRNKLVDIVSMQNDKVIYAFDINKINQDNAFPLDYRGVPRPNALTYPDLIGQYANGARFRIIKTAVEGMTMPQADLFGGTVRTTVELIKLDI